MAKLKQVGINDKLSNYYLIFLAKIYSRLRCLAKLDFIFSIINDRADLTYLKKIEILVLKIVNISIVKRPEKQLLDEA
jgi:hypothetical protein